MESQKSEIRKKPEGKKRKKSQSPEGVQGGIPLRVELFSDFCDLSPPGATSPLRHFLITKYPITHTAARAAMDRKMAIASIVV